MSDNTTDRVAEDYRALKQKIYAELARRGLLSIQLGAWWSPDTESVIYPKDDPEMIASAFDFCSWVERLTADWRTPS